nr:hypothetical protein [uncultured Duganella sp.]
MTNKASRKTSKLRKDMLALRQRICNPRSLIHSNVAGIYPPVGTFLDMALQSSAGKAVAPKGAQVQAAAQPKYPLTFADHLVQIDQFQGNYRNSLLQLLGAAYAACIVYDDKSETVKAANKAALEAKCATLKIEGKSYYQLIIKYAFGDDAKRASGFVHVIKAAENQAPSVHPDDFIAWVTSQGGIQQVRMKFNSDGTEKTSTTPSPADATAENISKAKNAILNACVTKIPYGQLPEITMLGNEGEGLAILRQQADGSVVIKLVLNDSKMVDTIYAAHGRTLK